MIYRNFMDQLKINSLIALSLPFIFLTGFVRPLVVPVNELPKSDKWSILEPEDQKRALKVAKDPLARAGLSEALEDWDSCVQNAKAVSPKSPVKDWALLLELNCAAQLADPDYNGKKKNTAAALSEALRKNEALPPTHLRPLHEKRKSAIINGRMVLCRNFKKNARWKELQSEVQKALSAENDYARNDRAELYELAGEVLVSERQWTDAFSQLQRSRDLNPDFALTDSKIKAILPLVPTQVREQFEARAKSGGLVSNGAPIPSTEEIEIVAQAESFLSRNDPASAVEALSKLLRKFPAGIKAKWAQDKIFELLSNEIDKSKGPNGPSVIKRKILATMGDFDSDRQADWAKALFDMQMYADAAPLAHRSAEQISGSARASKIYYLSGRAYQLSNEYSKAKEMFQLILKSFPASSEVVDAAIQWALININENDPSEAITHLEVARARKMNGQQDLISLFWLYQAYKMKNTEDQAANTAADLIKRFGLTYYGLIAYFDTKKSLPTFPKSIDKKAKIYLSIQEGQALERAKILLAAGLFTEASDELSVFSARPLSTDEEEYLVNFYAQAVKHQKAFALLSNLFDDFPEKKFDELVRKLFPKEFWDLVNNDKLRADLDPFLILSVMKQESGFDRYAVSRSGALGLLQMIPPTAQEVKKEINSEADVPDALTDPLVNVKFCAYYLGRLIKKYNGSIPLALAAYNAGPARITSYINSKGGLIRDTWVDELPWSETSFYVKSILKNYIMYRSLYGGMTQLPTPPWALPGSTSNGPQGQGTSASK